MNAANYNSHTSGTVGGVNCIDYAESDDQIFTFTKSGSNYILTTLSGYNIVCQSWNVDALKTSGTALTFVDNGDGTYCIKNGSRYFKIELVNGTYYPYCDAGYSQRATWKLEEVEANNTGGDTAPDCTVSVSSTAGGTATVTLNSLAQGYRLTATPEQGYNFVNWTVNGEVVSVSNPYTASVTANTEFVANFEPDLYRESEYVDLGLPSGIKWATCNVGANSPEEYGDYFAWGETEPKTTYKWSTYKWCNGSDDTMTKYCDDSYWGTVDNKTTLELTDDVARVNWGGKWRMPTKAEYDELMNTTNCTWIWTTQKGVSGYKVTSNVNGNTIFLPAAGYRSYGNLYYAGSDGRYWSSSLYTSSAYSVNFYSGDVDWGSLNRCIGGSVRAVCE